MNPSIPFHSLVEYVDVLTADDQSLFELIPKRQIGKRRLEIAENAAETLEAVRAGVAKRGSFEDLKADLLSDD